jgi:hypothetical protein
MRRHRQLRSTQVSIAARVSGTHRWGLCLATSGDLHLAINEDFPWPWTTYVRGLLGVTEVNSRLDTRNSYDLR